MTLHSYRITPKAPQTSYLVRTPEPDLDTRFADYLRDPAAQRTWCLLYDGAPVVLDFEGVRDVTPCAPAAGTPPPRPRAGHAPGGLRHTPDPDEVVL